MGAVRSADGAPPPKKKKDHAEITGMARYGDKRYSPY